MNDKLDYQTPIKTLTIDERYQRAQAISQGRFSKTVAFNTIIVPRWIGDSECFWYERELKEGKEFRLVDANAKSNEVAFDHAVLADVLAKASEKTIDATNLPITKVDLVLSPLQLKFTAFGKRWLFVDDKKSCTQIESQPSDCVISPDGCQAAFVRDDNLWVRELSTGEERALTSNGERFYSYAAAPSSWGSKLGASVEARWSLDSKRLFTLQLDTRSIKTLPILQHVPSDGSLRPTIINSERRVSFSGDTDIDEYRFLAIEVGTGKQQDAHFRRCPVFRNASGFFKTNHGWWGNDSRHAYFIDMERNGDHVARLLEFDTDTGAIRVLIEEESSGGCFKLRLDSRTPILTRPLLDSNEMIWFSERSGWGHLYLYDLKTGQLKHSITEGDWLVREIHHYDSERRELIIQTAGRVEGRHAYYRDICRVNIDTGKLTPILSTDDEYVVFDARSELAANFGVSRDIVGGCGVSPTGDYLVTTRSKVNEVPVSLLVDKEGNELLTLETADVSGLPDGWVWPESVKLRSADDTADIYGVVYRPSYCSSDESYPVIDRSYSHKEGGFLPAGSFVNNSLAGASFFAAAALAELGFIVVDIYGRGTSNRHQAFNNDPNTELPLSHHQADRVTWIRQLAERYSYIDINRVGSGGIQSTSAPIIDLLGYPDFYMVGVSNGASTDLRLAPAFFGESYGGLSKDALPPTESYAANLKGKLLIMHGILCASVNVSYSYRIIAALQKVNKDFDMLVLPEDGYAMSDYAVRRGWDYFVKHLLNVEPPVEFELDTGMGLLVEMKKKQAAGAK